MQKPVEFKHTVCNRNGVIVTFTTKKKQGYLETLDRKQGFQSLKLVSFNAGMAAIDGALKAAPGQATYSVEQAA